MIAARIERGLHQLAPLYVSVPFALSALSTSAECRSAANTWKGASGQGSLPASSAPVPWVENLCMQYYRNGTCSKGASCERLHGIYCKVPCHSLLVTASSNFAA